jgi:tripeptide aminopeptidase
MRAAAVLVVLLTGQSGATSAPDAAVRQILDSPKFAQAAQFIDGDYERFVRELIALTEIPAPPFKEARRARAVMEMMRELGLADVELDEEGNVLGIRHGTAARVSRPLLAVVAHLDTVFPEGTDVTVKRDAHRLLAPGVGDNTRGVALMLSVIRALDAAKFQTSMDVLFVGGVGEEGEGDLRGVKHLLRKGRHKDRIRAFIAIDGGEQSTITRGGVGSRRYRVAFKGPGGHSYGAFGLVNPAFAMGNAIAKFSRIRVPASPKTTFNVGVVSGGTSVNAIPFAVQMDVDMRSESCVELKKLDDEFLRLVREAADEENRVRATREGRIEADPRVIGDRPCGETPLDSPIVQATAAVVKAFGMRPSYNISSTDANLPMSMGIPAVTIGRGPGGRAHSPDEWTDVNRAGAVRAVQVAMTIILAVAGAN